MFHSNASSDYMDRSSTHASINNTRKNSVCRLIPFMSHHDVTRVKMTCFLCVCCRRCCCGTKMLSSSDVGHTGLLEHTRKNIRSEPSTCRRGNDGAMNGSDDAMIV
jgi:hypothetical protein